MDSFPIQNRNLKSGRIRLSAVDRLKPRSTAPVDRSNPRAKPCQSVDRAVDRFSSAVNRSVDRYCLYTLVHTDRPAGRPVTAVGQYWLPCLRYFVFVFGYLYLFLPTILHLGEDFSNLSRTQHRICRLESGCTSVAAYVRCPRDQAIRSSSKGASTSSVNMKDMEQCFTMCKFYS